jgi:glycosyltransferase involved in cell wall biosynthesis
VKILFLHHHVRGGGVTRVLGSQMQALQEVSLPTRCECRLWTADPQTPRDFADLSFDYQTLAELDYLAADTGPETWQLIEQTLYAHLHRAAQQGWLLHSHNSSLGKNPLVTWVLYRLAREGVPILFQYHDFAEDARPANYQLLKALLQERFRVPLADILYPGFARCLHVAINSRDRDFLARLPHLPTANVHLLPNAVDIPDSLPKPRTHATDFRNSLRMRPQGALWTYPVRGIRRKNLGEFALLAALYPEHNYVLTLAPQNPLEAEAYDVWVDRVRHLGLPLHVNAGALWPFEDIMAHSDGVVTTSIREGFGLAFLEPWLRGKAVTGRDLPEITRDFKAHGLDLSHFYTRLDVPLDPSEQQILSEAYRAYAQDYSNAMGIAVSVETLEQIVKAKVGPWTDFAALDRHTQMNWVERVVADPGLATRIRRHNKLDPLWCVSSEQVQHNRQQIRQHFGLRAYGSTLVQLYRQLAESQSEPDPPLPLDNPMLRHFFHPDHLQLLRK